jgi:hypothetical protein
MKLAHCASFFYGASLFHIVQEPGICHVIAIVFLSTIFSGALDSRP